MRCYYGVSCTLRRDGFFFFFQAEDGIRDYKVTGVQTCALPISAASASRAARAATRLSRSMLATAAASASSGAAPSLAAVVITPVPSGLERNTRSPARRPPLISTRAGWTRPVTQRPYFGSLSTTGGAPAVTPPAPAAFPAPPRN